MALDVDTITDAALAVLDEVGLDRLAMRAVAARLGVRAGALYYHVPDKDALLRLMADRLCAAVVEHLGPPPDPAGPGDGLALCEQVRRTMLTHRDAARILVESPLVGSPSALDLMERLIVALEPELGPAAAAAADALFSYLSGYLLQEQLAGDSPAYAEVDLETLRRRFPRVFAAVGSTPAAAPDGDPTFRRALEAIVAGYAASPRSAAP